MRNKNIFAAILISVISNLIFPVLAQAQDTLDQKTTLPPVVAVKATVSGTAFGGEGGGPFETSCPTGYVATGVYLSSNYSSYQYNYALAIKCTQVKLSTGKTLYLSGDGTKKIAFEWGGETADQPSVCSSGNALTSITGYHFSYSDFIADLAAGCSTFASQNNNETIQSAVGWDSFANPRTTSCPVGSFVTGLYGRNGEGIDKIGVRCGVFYIDYPKAKEFESAFPMDLISVSPASLSKVGEYISCNPGAFGYQYVGMAAKDVQKMELDSVTLLLKIDGQIVGASSSDDFKNLPKWILGIDDKAVLIPYDKSVVTWKISSVSSTAKISCQVMAYKEHQLTYITVS